MEQYISKSALVAEIKRRREPNAKERYFGRLVEDNYFLDFLDTIEVKEVQEKPVSIWYDANQPPEINTPILVRTYDNIVESTKRYDDNLIPWEDRIKRDEITHWCYVEDLIKTIKL